MIDELPVQPCLKGRKVALDDALLLVGQILFHVLLQPTKQEWPEHQVQTPDDEQLFFFAQDHLLLAAGICKGRVEPLIERFDGLEDCGEDKVEKCPQLREIVLERCTCKDESVARVVVVRDGAAEFRICILHPVPFVDNHVKPFDLAENRSVFDDELIRCQQNLKIAPSDRLL